MFAISTENVFSTEYNNDACLATRKHFRSLPIVQPNRILFLPVVVVVHWTKHTAQHTMEQDFKGSKIIYTNAKGSHSFVFEFLWKESHMWSYPEFHSILFKSMQTYKLVLTLQKSMVANEMALTFLCIIFLPLVITKSVVGSLTQSDFIGLCTHSCRT